MPDLLPRLQSGREDVARRHPSAAAGAASRMRRRSPRARRAESRPGRRPAVRRHKRGERDPAWRSIRRGSRVPKTNPQTPKNSPSVNGRTVGDSTWITPVESCVWRGEMKLPPGSIPMPAGTTTRLPSTKTSRCACMCSSVPSLASAGSPSVARRARRSRVFADQGARPLDSPANGPEGTNGAAPDPERLAMPAPTPTATTTTRTAAATRGSTKRSSPRGGAKGIGHPDDHAGGRLGPNG